ncbi:family 43 glycoside hydrolase [Melampsora larici-populina 98AG31]|uniref:Family 43 glycoside hydrolase n=1 Tax=Melampsora larici-populina (strain 98AG31 / pathotype 3-4-7) TaxID=747676 RepID=F4R605_MELLP|nr:family 43 glycoside hydrolase [Melampsora larici-populina 98AG31]EGG12133.1 family 43 glycoside hydrolase [Melampsora larici-populina 98AG31]
MIQASRLRKRARIVSGAIRNDDAGNQIQAHGGSLLQLGNEWYWFGCYRSNDLASWTRLPNVLSIKAGTPLNGDMVGERPRVIFNQATNKFVMYFHYDDPQYVYNSYPDDVCPTRCPLTNFCIFNLKVTDWGKLVSRQVGSGWKFDRAISPLNSQSRDLSLFQDDDGTAYVTFASDSNANLKLARLSKDYMDVEELVYVWKQVFWEATGMIKEAGVYHMMFSLQKGWSANANKVTKASNLAGPWSDAVDIADPKLNTYSSQNTYELTVTGTQATTHICRTIKTTPNPSSFLEVFLNL